MIQQTKYLGIQNSISCHCLICISSQIIRKLLEIRTTDANSVSIVAGVQTKKTWCVYLLQGDVQSGGSQPVFFASAGLLFHLVLKTLFVILLPANAIFFFQFNLFILNEKMYNSQRR